ncbi:MAG: Macrolide export ATP-binding/permease protein MacB [Verrucomicrobia bacterium ADurb.Bin018]|nr:MAG: Macrolide export ATP-binding/permease protein MacB [Verrucomicrobia bacterium ADurb.Bin018]
MGAGPRDERGDISALLLTAAGTTAPEELQRRARGLLCGFGLDDDAVEWITPDTLLRGVRRWQRAVGWVAGSSAALGLLLGAVSLAGMLLTGVRERVAEIGLRRALGARPHEIALLFVAEAAVLGLGAALLGLLGAGAVLLGQGARFPLPFHFGVGAWLIPLVLAGGIVILCSLGPAWQAARLPPAEALRNE